MGATKSPPPSQPRALPWAEETPSLRPFPPPPLPPPPTRPGEGETRHGMTGGGSSPLGGGGLEQGGRPGGGRFDRPQAPCSQDLPRHRLQPRALHRAKETRPSGPKNKFWAGERAEGSGFPQPRATPWVGRAAARFEVPVGPSPAQGGHAGRLTASCGPPLRKGPSANLVRVNESKQVRPYRG